MQVIITQVAKSSRAYDLAAWPGNEAPKLCGFHLPAGGSKHGNWKIEIGNSKIEIRKSTVVAAGLSRHPWVYPTIRGGMKPLPLSAMVAAGLSRHPWVYPAIRGGLKPPLLVP